jgi:hypothetical protein
MVSGGRWVRRGATFEDWPLQDPEQQSAEDHADAVMADEYDGTHTDEGDKQG